MMKVLNFFCICLFGLTITQSLPTQSTDETTAPIKSSSNYASIASQIIATNLLKSFNDIDGNQVYSPLGVGVELAVLAEAANGETYEEFNKVFGYPKERDGLRASYRSILEQYQKRDFTDEPSFQTWLYVYRNHSVREEFSELIKGNYFVEVKDINRGDYDWSEPNTSLDVDGEHETTTTLSNSKDVIGFETLKRLKINADAVADVSAAAKTMEDSYGEEILGKEASKFDRDIEDKQYVEKPVILAEIKNEEEKMKNEPQQLDAALLQNNEKDLSEVEGNQELKEMKKREEQINVEENETVSEDEKSYKAYNEQAADKLVEPTQDGLSSNEPEKVSIPLQKLENAMQTVSKEAGEIMIALESHLSSVRRVFGARSLFNKDDITSALSANSITGREIGSKTKMLLFNGLYFRGNWANGFSELRDAGDQFFFMTAEDAMKTTMMHATGNYHTADLEHLNAKALCLPYENKKYTLLVIVPNDVEGLHSLIEKIQPADISAMRSLGKEKQLHVVLPKFQIEETSRSESMLKNLGLQKLFSRDEADLSLLADDPDVHVDEIVQFVNIRVDEGGVTKGALSAASTQGRNPATEVESFEINRPFLYFVMDCEKEFVLVSGKVYAPEFKEEEPLNIEVEFQQA